MITTDDADGVRILEQKREDAKRLRSIAKIAAATAEIEQKVTKRTEEG
jgi:hypothetical protein